MDKIFDAVVVGSGPNGLAAGITLARAGLKVLIREQQSTIGGALRTQELTLPGFRHDVGSTVQALAQVSPFMRSLPLLELGVRFAYPGAAFGQTVARGPASVCVGSVNDTAEHLGVDGKAYRRLFQGIVDAWEKLTPTLLGPPMRIPKHPFSLMNFGLKAIRPAESLARSVFRTEQARALFAGAAAHSIIPLDYWASAAFALVLMSSAHVSGWPVAVGGSQVLADAMAAYFRSLGGVIEVNAPVTSVDEFDGARAVLCDIGPPQLLSVAGHRLPEGYQRGLRKFRYGPGSFKMDWALSQPVPWKDPLLQRAGTVHVGADLDEICASERAAWNGRHTGRPFILLVQPTLIDNTRAPEGKHTLWGYCHVPNGSDVDCTKAIEDQIERYAPGFRDCVLGRSVMRPSDLQRFDANLIGGDITGGANLFSQTFTRPVARLNPYTTPVKGLYLCSASTPPGGGVHGMCGHNAAKSALAREFGIKNVP